MAEPLFWRVLEHLQESFPRFRAGHTRGLAWRFRRTIHVVDATVIQLLATCLAWGLEVHVFAVAFVMFVVVQVCAPSRPAPNATASAANAANRTAVRARIS